MKVAASYQGYKFDETKAYEKNGKLYVSATCKCDRCYNGIYVCRVENGQPVPHPNYNGICLKCGGSGYVQKEIRLYTDEEFARMEASNNKRKEKKVAEMEAKMQREYASNKADWLAKNKFNQDEKIYVYFPEDSFSVKETLKELGFYFNPNLFWHIDEVPVGYEDKVIEVNANEVLSFSAWGKGIFNSNAKELVLSRIEAARPHKEYTSEWIGQEKERLRDIICTLVSIREMETRFGWTQLVRFETECGNVLTWWTSAEVKGEVGEVISLTGTVKSHNEYKGEKTTVLNRCILKEVK